MRNVFAGIHLGSDFINVFPLMFGLMVYLTNLKMTGSWKRLQICSLTK